MSSQYPHVHYPPVLAAQSQPQHQPQYQQQPRPQIHQYQQQQRYVVHPQPAQPHPPPQHQYQHQQQPHQQRPRVPVGDLISFDSEPIASAPAVAPDISKPKPKPKPKKKVRIKTEWRERVCALVRERGLTGPFYEDVRLENGRWTCAVGALHPRNGQIIRVVSDGHASHPVYAPTLEKAAQQLFNALDDAPTFFCAS